MPLDTNSITNKSDSKNDGRVLTSFSGSREIAKTFFVFFILGVADTADAGKGDKGGPPNRAPVIQGTPSATAGVGDYYEFLPSASDPDGDPLSFSIRNQPTWTNFDLSDGRLYGTPQENDVGLYSDITIIVSDGFQESSLAAFSIEVVDVAANHPPQIGGDPATAVMVGQNYSFTPSASDPDGDDLTFTVENKPGWANFSSADGTLSGTPTEADVGITNSVTVSVSDTYSVVSLPPFGIEVQSDGTGQGSATLNWTAPTERVDGSPLTNIAGYGIAYGTRRGQYTGLIEVNNPGITSYVVDNLTDGTWFFAVYVYDGYGLFSDYSNEASKDIGTSGGSGPGKGKK